jgi:hypothetical protein
MMTDRRASPDPPQAIGTLGAPQVPDDQGSEPDDREAEHHENREDEQHFGESETHGPSLGDRTSRTREGSLLHPSRPS